MDPRAMSPHGLALEAFMSGDAAAELVVRRDDGVENRLPASWFFRSEDEFTPIEKAALERCRGRVLDIGAGAGIHSLVLQARGLAVTAIDVDPQAVAVMIRRGVKDVRAADIFAFEGGPFDTLLMLGHGIGIAETLAGLDAFLIRARRLASPTCRLLIHSIDVGRTDDPVHLAYHEAARRAGRYPGEVRIELEFRGRRGRTCGWLHVDPRTLAEHAERAGWRCETPVEHTTGEHLSQLTLGESPLQ